MLEVVDLILLLRYCDELKPADIRAMWNRNFMLVHPDLKLKDVDEMLKQKTFGENRRQKLFDGYVAQYHDWLAENSLEDMTETLVGEKCSLDGRYWTAV